MLFLALTLCSSIRAQESKPQHQPTYLNDFQKANLGALPQDIMVLAGDFTIAEEGGNKFLQLPGSPLESYGLLLGPEPAASIQARIRATKTGKRTPEFGVGLGGAAGYKLWLMPAVNELQIIEGAQRVARVPYPWTSGTWTLMRLRLRTLPDGKTRIEGKAWAQDQQEPGDWTIAFNDPDDRSKGRASLWGTPYSDTPIAFDDLRITTAAE